LCQLIVIVIETHVTMKFSITSAVGRTAGEVVMSTIALFCVYASQTGLSASVNTEPSFQACCECMMVTWAVLTCAGRML